MDGPAAWDWDEPGGDLTFTIRVECTTCGNLMLFNSEKYRIAGEKILELQSGGRRGTGRPG